MTKSKNKNKDKNTVYLSLDDLHKLYGISPEVIKQIKKKRKKRRKRKQLKQLASEIKSTNLKACDLWLN
jgi:ABC-type lipoprotein release transport system permease subunit